MPTNERLNITISVEDMQFPMTVSNAEEEKLWRKAAADIQKRLQFLRSKYSSVPNEKYYYVMAMLTVFVDCVKIENKVDNAPYTEMMNGIEEKLAELGI